MTHSKLAMIGLFLTVALAAHAAPTGDFNGDGKTDIRDAILALRSVVGLIAPDAGQLSRSDMNGDGALGTADVLAILRIATSLDPSVASMPEIETAAENEGVTWGGVLTPSGPVKIWGIIDSGNLVVADAEGAPIRFERAVISVSSVAAEGEEAEIGGGLVSDGAGGYRIQDAATLAHQPTPAISEIVSLDALSKAVAAVDLGSLSYATYAKATSALCQSPTWGDAMKASLASAKTEAAGMSADGRFLALAFRGPRLPPVTGIVFRYLQVCVVYDLEIKNLKRILVGVEGWVEE